MAYVSAPEEEGKRLKPFEWTWRCDIVGGGSELAHGFGGGGWMTGEGLGGGGDGGDGGGGGGGCGRGGGEGLGRSGCTSTELGRIMAALGCEWVGSWWFDESM